MYSWYVGEAVAQKHTYEYKKRRASLHFIHTAQKMKFSIKDFSSKCHPNQQDTADLVKFTGEILNGKLYFFLE